MKPKWVCVECGSPHTRAWNAKRHIALLHQGNGSIVSFMEYMAGVNSGKYSPPTYAKLRSGTAQKPFKQSIISPAHIMIGLGDREDPNWWQELNRELKVHLSKGAQNSDFMQALSPADFGMYYVHYTGYVCPHCLAIGVLVDDNAAISCREGRHLCPRNFLFNPPNFNGDVRKKIINLAHAIDLPMLLYTVIKALSYGELWRLDSWPANRSNHTFVAGIDTTGTRWGSEAYNMRRTELSDAELRDFISKVGSTCGCVQTNSRGFVEPANVCLVIPAG